jgi:hypothetical protein
MSLLDLRVGEEVIHSTHPHLDLCYQRSSHQLMWPQASDWWPGQMGISCVNYTMEFEDVI